MKLDIVQKVSLVAESQRDSKCSFLCMKGGHGMRLIDADKLIELMIRDRNYAEKNGFMDMFYERQHLIDVIKK